MKGETKSKT